MEAMKVRRKVRKGNSFSSERSSETTAISSGTHPQSSWTSQAESRAWEHPKNKEQAKNTYLFDLSSKFARNLQKSHLKKGVNIDWGIIILI